MTFLSKEERDTINDLITKEVAHAKELLNNTDLCSWQAEAAIDTLKRAAQRLHTLERGVKV